MPGSRKPDRKKRREREKQERRARREAAAVEERARPRFRCGTCGTQFSHPGGIEIADIQLQNVDTGEVFKLPMDGVWQAPCPVCGQPAQAVNQHVVTEDGITGVGWADTPEQLQAFRDSLAELAALDDDASVDAIVEALERTGRPEIRPVIEYIRKHQVELAALGVLLQIVIALLTWLAPMDNDDAPPPPAPEGITYEQMERLVDEVKKGARGAKPPQHQPADGNEHGEGGPPRAGGPGGKEPQ